MMLCPIMAPIVTPMTDQQSRADQHYAAPPSQAVHKSIVNRIDSSHCAALSWCMMPHSVIAQAGLLDWRAEQILHHAATLQGMMLDPVIAADGHTYERAALQGWLTDHGNFSPVTGQPLQHARMVDNVLIRSAISKHREQQESNPQWTLQSSPQDRLRRCF